MAARTASSSSTTSTRCPMPICGKGVAIAWTDLDTRRSGKLPKALIPFSNASCATSKSRASQPAHRDFIFARCLQLRQDGEGARRKAEPVLDLRPGDDDQRALRRHLVEIGHYLDLVV